MVRKMAESSSVKTFRAFTAVDLVTLAALAALFRAMDYVTGMVAFVFPFNTLFMAFSFGVTALVAGVIIRKTGVFTMFTIAAQLINFFLQGENLVAVLIMSFWGVLADIFVYIQLKNGKDPFSSMRDLNIASVLMGITWVITTYGIAFPIIFLVELSTAIYAALMGFGVIAEFLGGLVGVALGNKIKGLLG
jgi:hypothetical protein